MLLLLALVAAEQTDSRVARSMKMGMCLKSGCIVLLGNLVNDRTAAAT